MDLDISLTDSAGENFPVSFLRGTAEALIDAPEDDTYIVLINYVDSCCERNDALIVPVCLSRLIDNDVTLNVYAIRSAQEANLLFPTFNATLHDDGDSVQWTIVLE